MVEVVFGVSGWLLCFVGTVLGFTTLTSTNADRASGPLAVPLALAIGAFAVVPDFLGRIMGSLLPGLLLLGSVGWAAFARHRRWPLPGFGVSPDAAAVVVSVLLVLVVATLGLHDRILHVAFTGAIARGVLPLQHPFFPGTALTYHVGFDVFAAGLVEMGGLTIDTALATAQGFIVALMAIALKEHLPHTRFLWLLPVLAHGPIAVCTAAIAGGGVCGAFDAGFAGATDVVPPPFSNMMQPPQGLGLALAFSLLLVPLHTRRGQIAVGIGFLFLSQAHLVVFLVAGFGLVAGVFVDAVRARQRRRLAPLVPLFAAFLAWLALGSFGSAASAHLEPGGFFGARMLVGITVFLPTSVASLVLVLLRIARGTAEPLDVVLVAAGIAGTTVFLVTHYSMSWDIVKFGTVASYFFALALSRALTTLRRTIVIPIVVAASSTSIVWLVTTIVQNAATAPSRLTVPGQQFLARFGDYVAGRDCVSTRANAISAIGVLTVGSPLELGHDLVFDREQYARRLAHLERFEREGDIGALIAVGCPLLFRAAGAPHEEAVNAAMHAVGELAVGSSTWILYRFNHPE